MVPSFIVIMEDFPLTPNGKLDQRALPAPRARGVADTYIAPRNETERALAEIWKEILDAERIGAFDNFFDLGGHSLLATRAVSRIKSTFGLNFPLREFFIHPELEAQARLLTEIKGRGERITGPKLRAVERDGELPLSFAQERMWLLHRLDPDSAAYNIPAVLRFTGKLDRLALEKSLRDLLLRHESLRTIFTFDRSGEHVAQRILPVVDSVLRIKALNEDTLEKRRDRAYDFAERESAVAFDLERGPLLRVSLLAIDPEEHVLVVNMHHIISDGWSMGVLVKEFCELYRAYSDGVRPVLPELPIQYADFSVWQREWLAGAELEQQFGYWKNELAHLEPLELPTDRPRPAVFSGRGSAASFEIPPTIARSIEGICGAEGVTLFMVLMAAFNVLLQRYSGQSDIVLGTPVANRTRSELENLIGFFVNTLAIRTDLSGDPSFRELLARVKQTSIAAHEHQDIAFEYLVEQLNPDRDLSGNPFFRVVFVLQNATQPTIDLPGLNISSLNVQNQTTKFDLTLILTEPNSAGALVGQIEYNTDLFDESTIRRMIDHYRLLLENLLVDPDVRITQPSFVTEVERRQTLVEWNATKRDFNFNRCLHELFEDQVKRTPDAVALIFGGTHLTYGEFNRGANQLAHFLRKLGVGPEVPVAVCMERSIEMVTALYAVLKAGGAYVPIDPGLPAERVRFMLDGIPVVLTHERLRKDFESFEKTTIVTPEADAKGMEEQSDKNPQLLTTPLNAAYVIYTSGSTGAPKGVINQHAGVVNRLLWMQDMYRLTAKDRILQKTPYSFDVSVWEFFWPLFCGSTLVVAEPEGHRNPRNLADLIFREKITVLHFVPSMLAVFLDEALPEECASLRLIVTSGEALSRDLARKLHATLQTELHNLYGPTEAAIDVTVWKCEPQDKRLHVPIGKPIANIRIYIVDRFFRSQPVGTPGELCIAGIGLARGYRNQPGLTAEKFIPDPFATDGGERLYRTGDLARWTADGTIEYLGRIDFQVKLRGFRIELGEIEATIQQHPEIRDVAVTLRQDAGDARLVAYLILEQNEVETTDDRLLEFLQTKLPGYMLPSAFVRLESFPLSPNGKLNRKALPAPEFTDSSVEFVAPRDDLEKALAEIWAEILKVERIGVFDNFFRLGGHSLLATRVVARILKDFAVNLPLHKFFNHPDLGGQARIVAELRVRGGGIVGGPPLRAYERDGELPLSFAQERMWMLHRFNPDSATYNMPVALSLVGKLDQTALENSLRDLSVRHESLRTIFSFAIDGERVLQRILPAGESMLNYSKLPGESVIERRQDAYERVGREAAAPFDLEQGPLFRVILLEIDREEYVLIVNMHHIISDGWSLNVLVRDFCELYRARHAGTLSNLPGLAVQYPDYALWQRAWLVGDELKRQLEFWEDHLGGDLPVLELPTDRPRPVVFTQRGAQFNFDLPFADGGSIADLCSEFDVTPFIFLLTSFFALLHRYTAQTDLIVGTTIANRTRTEVENLIGFFVNTIALRAEFTGAVAFSELLMKIRGISLNAHDHQDIAFEHIVERLNPVRDTSGNPVFRAAFNYQNVLQPELSLPDLELQTLDAANQTTKFDLMLTIAGPEKSVADEGLRAQFEYNIDLFDEATIARMAAHYSVLLASIFKNPNEKIADLSILPAAERKCLLDEWSVHKMDASPGETFYCGLFEEQVKQTPDNVAVFHEGETMSYAELNRHANQLAHFLIRIGAGPEKSVGVCMSKSPRLLVALLALFKAGGTYVPLDPDFPEERMRFVLGDSDARILLIDPNSNPIAENGKIRHVRVDLSNTEISGESEQNPQTNISPENLAYIAYTSGSTGIPKGVGIEQGGVANMCFSFMEAHAIDADARVLLLPSISFDPSLSDMLPPLLCGATVLTMRKEWSLPGPKLIEKIKEYGVTNVCLPPSALRILGETASDDLTCLRTVVSAGEVCTEEIVSAWLRPGRIVVNGYGPTEVTIGSTFKHCVLGETPTIGGPFLNKRLYVLDANLRPVPTAVAGELCIGGVGVARGYLSRPDQTAGVFVPNPFAERAGERMYRTGDRVRWTPGGEIEYLGRIDEQVKLRGFRVEPGEVEANLLERSDIREAAVIVREDRPGEKALVAYLVSAKPVEPRELVAGCRDFLKERLPDYMVPAAFVVLDVLPVNTSGKVIKKDLPAPEAEDRSGVTYTAPTNETEERVAAIWRELLNLERAGLYDNFFDLGGHSLLLIRMHTKLSAVFPEIELPILELFQFSTVKAISDRIRALGNQGGADVARKVEQEKKEEADDELRVKRRLSAGRRRRVVEDD